MIDINLEPALWLSQAVVPHMRQRGSGAVNAVAPQLLDTPANRATFPAGALAHAVAPGAIAEVIAFLVSETAAPVSGAVLPAYGA